MLSAHKQLGRYTVTYSVFGDLLRFSKQSSVSSRLSSCIGTRFKYNGEPFYSSLCNYCGFIHGLGMSYLHHILRCMKLDDEE